MNRNKSYLRYGGIVTGGVVAIAILLNLFVSLMVAKFPIKIDLTKQRLYEISDTTKEFLSKYDKDTKIYFVAGESYNSRSLLFNSVDEVLKKYAQYSAHIEYVNIDARINPTFGTKYLQNGEQTAAGSVIIDAGDKVKTMYYSDLFTLVQNAEGSPVATEFRAEQVLNSALSYVSSTEQAKAYFVTGHNEMSTDGLRVRLESQNYTVSDLNLTNEDIPEDAQLVVISAPKIDYTPSELVKLDSYFDNAGDAIVLFDYDCLKLDKLYSYLRGWGIEVGDSIAVENSKSNIMSQVGVLKANYADSELTQVFEKNNRYVCYYPYAKNIKLLFEENNAITTDAVLTTSKETITTTDFDNAQSIDGEKSAQNIVVHTSKKTADNKAAEIYVFGSPLLLDYSPEQVAELGLPNFELVDNIVANMNSESLAQTVMPKSLSAEKLTMTDLESIWLGIILAIILPLALLVCGVVVWIKRRHL